MENSLAIKQKAFATHARIMANGEIVQNTLLEICKDLKAMRDERLYLELDYETFDDYAEQAVGIKKRQAYSYISTYEKLGEKYIEENAGLGITKLELISQISSYEREEFLEDKDVESESVRELKAQVDEFKKQTEQLSFTIEDQNEIIEQLKSDKSEDNSSYEEEIQKLNQTIAALEKERDEFASSENSNEQSDTSKYDEAYTAGKKEAEKAYKDKIRKLNDSKKNDIDNAVKQALSKEKDKTDKLIEENEKLKKQKLSIEDKLAEAEKKAKISGADPKVTMLKVYFDELQKNLDIVVNMISDISKTDSSTADKLKTVIISALQSTADDLKGVKK